MPNSIATPRPEAPQASPPEDLWVKCSGCKEIAFRKEVERNLNVCLKCGYHFRLTVEQRLSITADRGTWRELSAGLAVGDPLEFRDSKSYPERIEQARRASGRSDAVVAGSCRIGNRPVALAVMDFNFMGGSMGLVVGEKLAGLFNYARSRRIPVVVFNASGGARMQEGRAVADANGEGVGGDFTAARRPHPYISVCCDPTTGGVAASFAMLGDLNLAEPGALIGFAGRRVIEQTINQSLPDDFQKAEFLLAHGMLDAIVPRHQMRETLTHLLGILRVQRRHP